MIAQLPNFHVTCVDPEPESFRPGKIFMSPDYPYLEDVPQKVRDRTDILLLNWTEPNPPTPYDRDAIEKLCPPIIIISYGPDGCAGSNYPNGLNEMLAEKYIDQYGQHLIKPSGPKKTLVVGIVVYDLIHHSANEYGTGYGKDVTHTLLVYSQCHTRQFYFPENIPKGTIRTLASIATNQDIMINLLLKMAIPE
jgi:hypothetical protein